MPLKTHNPGWVDEMNNALQKALGEMLKCPISAPGTFRTLRDVRLESGMRSKADVRQGL